MKLTFLLAPLSLNKVTHLSQSRYPLDGHSRESRYLTSFASSALCLGNFHNDGALVELSDRVGFAIESSP